MKKVLSKWYWIIIGGFILFAAAVYIILGEDSVIAVHDNLDLFVPQYKMMKDTGTFFAHNASVPFLANISRDYLPSEFNLYTMVFMILPEYAAYIVCYFLKIGIGISGCVLLAKDILKDKFKDYESIIYLTSFAFAILNLFPNFGIAFAAIPYLVFIMHRIITKPKWYWFIALFCYPFISYFSYLGIFFIGYLCLYFIYKWIASRKFPWRVLISIPILSLGYVAFEYRLFNQMLFLDIESIRTTMVQASLGWKDIFAMMWEGFAIGDMHTESVHLYFVMPVCLLYFIVRNAVYIKNGQVKRIFTDYFNGVILFIIFNSAMYGLYYWEPLRDLFEAIFPPLKGFEFHRLEFVNPFLWYVAFFIVLKRVYDEMPKLKWLANVAAVAAVFIIVLNGGRYNDLFHTCLNEYSKLMNGRPTNDLTYREFYSVDLFEKAKKDIDYDGEWAVAYGFYPAVLEYNDIHTLDGYLGYYPEWYKQDFREIIAPALDRIPESKDYYDGWGARCYMYSGTYPSNTNAYRNYEYTDEDLYIDIDAFKGYVGRYIFSRVKLNNADEVGFDLVNVYTDDESPYTLYVYRTKSWFREKEHSEIPFDQRTLDYDTDKLDGLFGKMDSAVQSAGSKELTSSEIEVMKRYFKEAMDEILKMNSASGIAQIEFYKDVNNEEIIPIMDAIYEDAIDYSDKFLQTLRSVAKSPYEQALCEMYSKACVDELKEYEDMTPEQKERAIKIKNLNVEYEQLISENYYFDYKGETYDDFGFDEEVCDLDDYDDVLAIYRGLYQEKAKAVGEVYKEFVKLYDEEAKEEGYDNFAEYAYAEYFPRDYSVEEIKDLCKEVRTKCGGYFDIANKYAGYLYYYDPGFITEDSTEMITSMLPVLEEIDPKLVEPAEHLLKLGLYDMEPRDTKSDRGTTLSFPSYGDAFIFDSPYENYRDVYTYPHEYGHFASAYYNTEDIMLAIDNIDTAEICSQGLEVLFNQHYKEMYDEETADFLEVKNIYGLLSNIYSACLYSEFEIYSFEHPDATVEELGIEFARLNEEYGYDYGVDDGEGLYFWCDVNHFFSSPCYYISYATSAFCALELYNMALEDEQRAANKYMQLLSMDSVWLFRETLGYVGLPDIFEKGVPKDVFKEAMKSVRSIAKKYESVEER